MGDLEDSVFKQNVPGRYSTWDRGQERHENIESDDDVGNHQIEEVQTQQELDSDLLNEARYLAQAEIPETIRRSILAERQRKASTGVKGVLADYKEAQAMAQAQQAADAKQRAAILTRMVEGYKVKNTVVASGITDAVNNTTGSGSDFSDDDDDEDDEFMREFRDKRLRELRSVSMLPSFGTVREVTSADFISEVEQVDKRAFVIVHLYESSVQSCVRLNRMLEEITVEMPLIKFLRMQASSNMIPVDLVTLPILTIYRGGESLKVLAGISHELGTEYFEKDDIEWLLINALSELG